MFATIRGLSGVVGDDLGAQMSDLRVVPRMARFVSSETGGRSDTLLTPCALSYAHHRRPVFAFIIFFWVRNAFFPRPYTITSACDLPFRSERHLSCLRSLRAHSE